MLPVYDEITKTFMRDAYGKLIRRDLGFRFTSAYSDCCKDFAELSISKEKANELEEETVWELAYIPDELFVEDFFKYHSSVG